MSPRWEEQAQDALSEPGVWGRGPGPWARGPGLGARGLGRARGRCEVCALILGRVVVARWVFSCPAPASHPALGGPTGCDTAGDCEDFSWCAGGASCISACSVCPVCRPIRRAFFSLPSRCFLVVACAFFAGRLSSALRCPFLHDRQRRQGDLVGC